MGQFLEDRPTIQAQLDEAPPGAVLQLLPREYAGPGVARRPLTLDGRGATFWALDGPTFAVDADGVRLKNLRVEVTGTPDPQTVEACALLICSGRKVEFENVTVRGVVLGLPGEDGPWHLPPCLHAGRLEPGREHRLLLRLYVPLPCRLESGIAGVEVEPTLLPAGVNEVCLAIERLPADTLLHGDLTLSTALLKRTIAFTAHVCPPRPQEEEFTVGPMLWAPAAWDALVAAGAPGYTEDAPRVPVPPAPFVQTKRPTTAPATPALPPPPQNVPVPGVSLAPPRPPAVSPAPTPVPVSPVPVVPPSPAVGGKAARPGLRVVTGSLVSNLFEPNAAPADSPPADAPPADPQPATEPAQTAAAPATTPPEPPAVPPARPRFRMKPMSKLFDPPPEEKP